MAGIHAILGASSSHRWLECPGSIKLSQGMPNEESVYAREGSCAHALGELCLRNGGDALFYEGDEMEGYEDIEVTEEMCQNVQVYLDAIRNDIGEYVVDFGKDYELGIETKFDLSHVHPGMFGTSDANVLWPARKKLTVYDYKNGWFAVAAKNNPQTMYYGLGALHQYHNYDIETIEFVIVQPRTGQNAAVKRWECSRAELLAFRDTLIAGALATESENPLVKAGEWCKFCPAARVDPATGFIKCRIFENTALESAMAEFDLDGNIKLPDPAKMSPERLRLAWDNAGMMEAWAKNLKAFCHVQALDGNLLPRTRLVPGRSNRRWKSVEATVDKLKKMLALGYFTGELYTFKLKSPAQIEKMLPKKEKDLIENLWEKPEARLSLVDESDDRQSAKVDAVAEFS